MRIQHNITAMNSYRNYSANTRTVAKNLEKLSSGYKINRAGDDAAGLAISEKMRAQITGLETAQKNAKDGISLVQTAEGALTEVHSMLNRMVELADQSANGTYDNETDRANLQKEVTQLKSEINRIADSTNFNGIKLLDGSLGENGATAKTNSAVIAGTEKLIDVAKSTVGATTGTYSIQADLDTANTDGSGSWNAAGGKQLNITLTDTNNKSYTLKFSFDGAVTAGDLATAINTELGGGTGIDGATAEFKANNQETINDLKKVFGSLKIETAGSDGITVTATSATSGSAGVGLKTMKLDEQVLDTSGVPQAVQDFTGNAALTTTPLNANVTIAPVDSYTKLTASGGTLAAGEKVTIGDHTFEMKAADDYNTTEGNIRVVVGADETENRKNLVAAMKSAGITSASLTSDGNIKIGDENQLKTSDKTINFNNMAEVKSASLGVTIENVDAVNGNVTFTVGAPTDNTTTQKLGIGYTDADGKAQSVQVDYVGGADAATTGKAMANAINTNEATKNLFKATANDLTGEITLEALGGKEGVVVNTVATTDAAAGALGAVTAGTPSERAGKTIEVSNTGLAKGDIISVGGKEYQFIDKADAGDPTKIKQGATAVIIGTADADTAKNLQAALANDGVKASLSGSKLKIEDGEKLTNQSGGLTLQIGDTSDSFNKLSVSVGDMHAKSLGIDNVDISTQKGGSDAVQMIKDAINSVSSTRGDLGATQNRLDHTINNLSVMQENIQDAESSIRDVDVAKEMMAYTKNNILVQSAQAMLAQANQLPQGVLQLLG